MENVKTFFNSWNIKWSRTLNSFKMVSFACKWSGQIKDYNSFTLKKVFMNITISNGWCHSEKRMSDLKCWIWQHFGAVAMGLLHRHRTHGRRWESERSKSGNKVQWTKYYFRQAWLSGQLLQLWNGWHGRVKSIFGQNWLSRVDDTRFERERENCHVWWRRHATWGHPTLSTQLHSASIQPLTKIVLVSV